MTETVPAPLAPGARRLILYSFYDPNGRVDEFVTYSLASLRPHAAQIVVVVNGDLDPPGRSSLERVADQVIVRENAGFDIGAHRDVMLGRIALLHSVSEFDEVVMTNDTWFGPVKPWADVFSRLDSLPCHFWGLTDHAAAESNPLTGRTGVRYHIQSYWIAVRSELLRSPDWRHYWEQVGSLDTYADAVVRHELRMTEWFALRGWHPEVAFPFTDFDTENPSLFEARALVSAGCPALKRRALFHWPPTLASRGSVGSQILEAAQEAGYPVDMALSNLARTVEPRVVNVATGLHDVLVPRPGEERPDRPSHFARWLIVAYVSSSEEAASLPGRLANLRGVLADASLLVTARHLEFLDTVRSQLDDEGRGATFRLLALGTGGAIAALLLECRDAILQSGAEVVYVVRGAQRDGGAPSGLDELMMSREHAELIARRFVDRPGIGLVFASPDRLRSELIGDGWRGLKDAAAYILRAAGIGGPLDDVSPLAPYGGGFLARPAALSPLLQHSWQQGDLLSLHEELIDDVLERVLAASAGHMGMATATVVCERELSLSHTLREYEVSAMSATIPGDTFQKIDFLRHSGPAGSGSPVDILRMYLRRRWPRVVLIVRRFRESCRLTRRARWRS